MLGLQKSGETRLESLLQTGSGKVNQHFIPFVGNL